MNELLELAIKAHGGMNRWNQLKTGSAHLVNGGVLWEIKGQRAFIHDSRVTVELHRQKASHAPFLTPDQRTSLEPHRVAIESLDGKVIKERLNPRASFQGHVIDTKWDDLQLAYFAGYAMWTYLTAPFSFTMPGFESQETEPWSENGEEWRRLEVKFPKEIATHSAEQTFYFDQEGFLKRHDYDVEVAKGATGAHYVFDYKEFDGIMVPTKRRVYARSPDGKALTEPLLVSIDLSAIKFT
jgi:hypothetical protein